MNSPTVAPGFPHWTSIAATSTDSYYHFFVNDCFIVDDSTGCRCNSGASAGNLSTASKCPDWVRSLPPDPGSRSSTAEFAMDRRIIIQNRLRNDSDDAP
jgi:hypothetical protein